MKAIVERFLAPLVFLLGLLGSPIALSKDLAAQHEPLTSESLILSPTFSQDPVSAIEGDQQRADLNILLYAFHNAYGGRNFISNSAFQSALSSLEGWKKEKSEPLSSLEFCKKLDSILSVIPDNHFMAKQGTASCGKWERRRKGTIGTNLATTEQRTWIVKKTGSTGMIGISKFPGSKSVEWNGFVSAVQEVVKRSESLIVDLRGNSGGSDAMGIELAKILYGGKPPSPVKARITSTTPATYAILLNAEILQASTGAKSDSEWQSARIAEARKRYTDSLRKKGKLESISTDPAGTAYSAASGFSGKIAVLVDAECASSCESTLGYLKFHPKLKVVGENTAGYFHFGNLGAVYLPNSRVTVMMASDFWKLRNGEYLENIGYSPDVRVRSGQDAMSAAIDFLKTSRSN